MENPTLPVVTVERFYLNQAEKLQLKLVAGGAGLHRKIQEGSVNRPGLALAGFYKYFAFRRVQVMGGAEWQYLKSQSTVEAHRRVSDLLKQKIPCLAYARNVNPPKYVVELCDELEVPLFKTKMITMKFINAATIALELEFAPTATEHGSMVDILGIGVLIRGESGIGKSESVLALLERGYSLVSDDITRIRLQEGRELVGTSSETTRFHMEIRGIGIINVPAVFGVAAVRPEKNITLVVPSRGGNKMKDFNGMEMRRKH